jgi:hypothetical protein
MHTHQPLWVSSETFPEKGGPSFPQDLDAGCKSTGTGHAYWSGHGGTAVVFQTSLNNAQLRRQVLFVQSLFLTKVLRTGYGAGFMARPQGTNDMRIGLSPSLVPHQNKFELAKVFSEDHFHGKY